jgi:hypothetical protein
MENKTNTYDEPVQQEQESILEDTIDTSAYEKTLKRGRVWLYIIAAMQSLMGIYEYATEPDNTIGLIAMGIDMFIGATFLTLALWSRSKPIPAFTTALVLYILFVAGFMWLDPSNIYKGILIKIFVVIALFKANRDAREFVAAKSL